MSDPANPASVVRTITLRGKQLTAADVRRAERLRDQLEGRFNGR
jgi:hypothetical protein